MVLEMIGENATEVDVMLITGDVLSFSQRLKSASYDEETEMFRVVTSEGDNFFPRESIVTFFVKHEEESDGNNENGVDNVISFRG